MMASGDRSQGVRAENLLGVMISRSIPWAGGAGIACVGVYAVVDGLGAALAAVLGVALVACFFGVDLIVMRLTRDLPGPVTAFALLTEYLVKVVVLAAVLWAISEATEVDLQATAVTVVVTTIVGATAVTMVAVRAKSFYFDFPDRGSAETPDNPGNTGDSRHADGT